MAERLTFRLH